MTVLEWCKSRSSRLTAVVCSRRNLPQASKGQFSGREVATRVFGRRADAVAWEQEQARQLRHSDCHDPRRGRVTVDQVAARWLASRSSAKRRTVETDAGNWQRYIAPRWAKRQVASMTPARSQAGSAPSSTQRAGTVPVTRALATMRSLMAFAVEDRRIAYNPAAAVRRPSGGQAPSCSTFPTPSGHRKPISLVHTVDPYAAPCRQH